MVKGHITKYRRYVGYLMAKKVRAKKIRRSQPEQTVLHFKATGTSKHIDLAAALTAVNRKQYHMTRKLKPLAYHYRAQAVSIPSGDIRFSTAANTWTTRNALTMFGAMYKKQLRNNNIRIGQLPKYGREIRYALTTGEKGFSHASGSDGYNTATLTAEVPSDWSETSLFASYTTSDGDGTISYSDGNELTLVTVASDHQGLPPQTIVPCITGTSNFEDNKLAVIPEYLGSRSNTSDEVESLQIPDSTSLMMRIGSTSEENFDDVVEAVDETGDHRPYNLDGANLLVPQGFLGVVGDYTSGVAPCGLIQVDCADDAEYLITVTGITEM